MNFISIRRSLTFVIAATLFISKASAQMEVDSSLYGYTLLRNDPYSVPKFGITAYPLLLQWGSYGSFAACYGGDIRWDALSFFTFTASGFQSYGKGTWVNTDQAINLKPYMDIHAGGIIYISNTEAKSKHDIDAWYKDRFRVMSSYLKNVEMTDLTKFGFEAGWYRSNSVVVGKRSVLSGYMVTDSSRKVYDLKSSSHITSLSSSNIYIGINWADYTDYHVRYDRQDLEDEEVSAIVNFYFDMIFPYQASFTQLKVTDPGDVPSGIYELNDNTSHKRNGFRFGINTIITGRPGFSYGLELGRQPAVPKHAFYLLFKLGFGWHI
jgi:hypothetical protein